MKKIHLMKKLNIANKGISLIEVIVSMLILMIIVVPLLSGFATARKSNETAKANTYARAVGESVVESVKLLGLEGTAKEFYKTAGTDDFIMAASYSGFNEVLPLDESGNTMPASVIVDANGVKRFSPRSTGEYEYKITGVKQGVDTYDVKLKISNTAYSGSGSINSYLYADMSAFNATTTAVINPVLATSTYEYKALQYFKTMHERYKYSVYAAGRDEIDMRNADKLAEYYWKYEEYEKGNASEPPFPILEPVPTQEPTVGEDVVVQDITKTLTVDLKKESVVEGSEYTLNSSMVFYCDNSADENTGTRLYAAAGNVLSKTYSGYCSSQRYDNLETLLILYTPFSSIDTLNRETIVIDKKTPGPLDIYLVIQADENASFAGKERINIDVSDDSVDVDNINVYCQAKVNTADLSEEQCHEYIISDMSAGDDTLYNIDVEVYRAGTTDLVQTVKSTFVNK